MVCPPGSHWCAWLVKQLSRESKARPALILVIQLRAPSRQQLHISHAQRALLFLSPPPLLQKARRNKPAGSAYRMERSRFHHHPSSCTAAPSPQQSPGPRAGCKDRRTSCWWQCHFVPLFSPARTMCTTSTLATTAFSQFPDSSSWHLAGWGCCREGDKRTAHGEEFSCIKQFFEHQGDGQGNLIMRDTCGKRLTFLFAH